MYLNEELNRPLAPRAHRPQSLRRRDGQQSAVLGRGRHSGGRRRLLFGGRHVECDLCGVREEGVVRVDEAGGDGHILRSTGLLFGDAVSFSCKNYLKYQTKPKNYRTTLVVAYQGWLDLVFNVPLSAGFGFGSWELGSIGWCRWAR